MIDEVFSSLSTIEWSNVSRLVEESPSIYQNMLSSHDVYRNILASLSSLRRTTKNNTLGTYCLKCCRYLKQKHIESLFHKTFASKHTDMEEDQIIKIIQFTLTDFAGKCNRSQIFEPKHERTFWIDKIIPIFQSIGDQTGLVGFEWCEKNPESFSETTTDLETWKHGPVRYVDGLGYREGRTDIIVMEASSGKNYEDLEHSRDDTLKNVHGSICALEAS